MNMTEKKRYNIAGNRINKCAKFKIDGAVYKIISWGNTNVEDDEEALVKAIGDDKYVKELLAGFNMSWSMGRVPHSQRGIRDYFLPLT